MSAHSTSSPVNLDYSIGRNGYEVTGVTSPIDAIEMIRNAKYDLLILDFLMSPINGDIVVEQIREFNSEIYILLLTGHKDMAPPLETIKKLEIQGYCEKSDKFEQLILLVESAIKSIMQMCIIKKFQYGLNRIIEAIPKIYQLQPIASILEGILIEIMYFVNSENAFILVDNTQGVCVKISDSLVRYKQSHTPQEDGNIIRVCDRRANIDHYQKIRR